MQNISEGPWSWVPLAVWCNLVHCQTVTPLVCNCTKCAKEQIQKQTQHAKHARMIGASSLRSKRTVSEHIARLCTKHLILSTLCQIAWTRAKLAKLYIFIQICISSFAFEFGFTFLLLHLHLPFFFCICFSFFYPPLHKNDKQCWFAFDWRRRLNYKQRKLINHWNQT